MPLKPRKIPMRMCVGCHEMKPKATLVRIVKPQDQDAHVDRTGKAAGRGAYVCESLACLRRAEKTRALERALDTKIGEDVFAQLEAQLAPEENI